MSASRPPPKQRSWSWRSQAFRGVVYQVLALAVLFGALAYLLNNTFANMRLRGIQSGFSFILQPAGFAIGETMIPFDSSESYLPNTESASSDSSEDTENKTNILFF